MSLWDKLLGKGRSGATSAAGKQGALAADASAASLRKGGTLLRSSPVVPKAASPARADAPSITGWQPGEIILGEYRVERELGHGSMGTVYLVAHTQSTGLHFALKRIHIAGEVYRRNFLAELQTWIDLSEYPHLVSCRFFRTIGEELVIFAEYVDGTSLSKLIKEKKLTRIETLLDIAIQFAWGLHAAHEQGVIHQDVKPSNALIATDGTVKVADFGLARAQAAAAPIAQGDTHRTVLVAHAGGMTDEYCSPEQAEDQPLSRRSDLWSWGVSMLEMFSGQVTWRSGVLAATALEDFVEEQRRADTVAKGQLRMPLSVAAVLRRCFREDPDERWPSLLAAAQALVEAHRVECGTAFPGKVPAMPTRERGAIAALDRKFVGAEWGDPKAWLIEALRAAGRNPAEADTLAQSTGNAHGLKAQAVGDLGTYQEAQRIFERLIAVDRSELRERLAALCMHQALVHRFVDDAPGAIRAYDRAIAIRERLVNQEGRGELANELAMAYMNKAIAVSDLGDKQAAVGLYDRAIAIFERLVNQEGRRELTGDLAWVQAYQAGILKQIGERTRARTLARSAIATLEIEVNRNGRADLTSALSWARQNLSDLLNDHTDNDETSAEVAAEADSPKAQPLVRQSEKVGRNDPCPCGSGKRYKQCHGRLT